MWQCFSTLSQFAAPKIFYIKMRKPARLLAYLSVFFLISGMILGLWGSPPDYQQGEAVRMMYVHVPSAFLSMACFAWMGGLACLLLIWRIKLAGVLLRGGVVVGTVLTGLALVTGSLWGRPMWGTWWVWDARLTSEFILWMIYVAMWALQSSFRQREVADRAMAIVTLVGLVDLPIIHYSVYWWNTLHQGSSFPLGQKPLIDTQMLWPLGFMLAGLLCLCAWVVVQLARAELLERAGRASWAQEVMR